MKKAVKRSLKNFADFTRPLQFAPEDNGFSIQNPQLKWQFENGKKINLGGLKIDSNAISMNLDQIRRDAAPVRYDTGRREPFVTTISFEWPEILTPTGTISIETADGETKWAEPVGQEERLKFKDERFYYASEPMRKNHQKALWGFFDIPRDTFAFLWKGGRYRMCVNQVNSDLERLKICSRLFETKSKGEELSMASVEENQDYTVMLDTKAVGKAGILNFRLGKEVVLRVAFSDNSFVEVASQPANPRLIDVIESPDGKEIILTGHGAKPLGKVQMIVRPVTHFWAPTGIAQESIWTASVPKDAPTLRVLGAFNIPFTLLFVFDRLPKEKDRVYIRETRSTGTYSSSPIIQGFSLEPVKVSSSERWAKSADAHKFNWEFAAPNKGEENRSRIRLVTEGNDKPWVAHHRLYRTFPYELSGRLTGIASVDQNYIILGEAGFGAWFETLFGWQSPLFSKQRWGFTARYFKSLTAIAASTGAKVDDLSVANFDLRYNILAGAWGRDELVGITASSERITLAGNELMLVGGGAYWARTMPKVFDQLFNLLPLMEYPKYVDMEFIMYPVSMTGGIGAGTSFNLNFHGRVFWTQRFYGEAGFGIRRYEFTAPNARGQIKPIALSAAYGTAGLGFVF